MHDSRCCCSRKDNAARWSGVGIVSLLLSGWCNNSIAISRSPTKNDSILLQSATTVRFDSRFESNIWMISVGIRIWAIIEGQDVCWLKIWAVLVWNRFCKVSIWFGKSNVVVCLAFVIKPYRVLNFRRHWAAPIRLSKR